MSKPPEGRLVNETLLFAAADREKKFYKPYTHFRPNFKVRPVAGKFYSRDEVFDKSLMNLEYREMLANMYSRTPKLIYRNPVLESHRYGWYTEPLMDNSRDFRLNYRHRMTPDIKLAIEMKKMTDKMRK